MVYNDTFMNNITSPLELITGLGTAMGNDFLMGNLLLLSFAFVFLALAYKDDFTTVLLIDGFVSTILAILLYAAGMIAATTIIYPALLFFLVMLFKLLS